VRRREFITLLGGAAVTWPLAARAQQPAMPVVGVLYPGSLAPIATAIAAFRKGLSEIGYAEGRNVALEFRSAENDNARLPELAAELVRRQVAVIAAPGSAAAAVAAKAATVSIPVVFGTGLDPVQLGLVASLSRPGGNVTGVSTMNIELATKRLGLLLELVPGAERIAVLVNLNDPSEAFISQVREAAMASGRQIEVFSASTSLDIDTALASVVQRRADALLLSTGAPFAQNRVHLATLSARYRMPAIYPDRQYAEAGGLMSYGSNVPEMYRQVGIYTGRVLKGEKPAELPVLQAAKFEFVINLNTARALGLEIPPTLLARADEVIE
jgi:putative tryptophan/tyrosine transport system substrate-binding protein